MAISETAKKSSRNKERTKKNPEKNFKSKAFQYKGWTVIIDGENKEEEHGV